MSALDNKCLKGQTDRQTDLSDFWAAVSAVTIRGYFTQLYVVGLSVYFSTVFTSVNKSQSVQVVCKSPLIEVTAQTATQKSLISAFCEIDGQKDRLDIVTPYRGGVC